MNRSHGIAVAHRSFVVDGGGEHVAEELARTFDAPLYTGYADGNAADDVDVREMWSDSRAGRLIQRGPPFVGFLKMAQWSTAQPLYDYETVITSGPEPMWFVPTDEQTVIAYCHSPMRWLYDQHQRADPGLFGSVFAAGKRVLYESAARRPDIWVANSDLIARRLRQHLSIPDDRIRVVYPPVKTRSYSPDYQETEDYYLHVGRLVDNKRVTALVEAFRGLDKRLILAGSGPQQDEIEARAPPNVDVLGYVSEERKRALLSGARAFVFAARNEDFCMSTVEALASGTPVITVDEGFPPFQVGAHRVEGRRGYTFERGGDAEETAAYCRSAIEEFEREGVEWSPERIARFADRFSADEFRRRMGEIVRHTREKTRVDPEWESEERERVVADGGDA